MSRTNFAQARVIEAQNDERATIEEVRDVTINDVPATILVTTSTEVPLLRFWKGATHHRGVHIILDGDIIEGTIDLDSSEMTVDDQIDSMLADGYQID